MEDCPSHTWKLIYYCSHHPVSCPSSCIGVKSHAGMPALVHWREISWRMQGAGHDIVCGDVGGAWEKCAHIVEGSVRVGGQEHFYLEPQGTVILPSENDEYIVISSTQVRHHRRLKQQWVWALCVQER